MEAPFATGTWNGVEGAYYMGLGTSWEWIWLLVSVAFCVMALFVGGVHEAIAYGKATGRAEGKAEAEAEAESEGG